MDRWCTDRRGGLAQTSTGTGHAYVQPPSFRTDSCKDAPLPPLLQRQSRGPGPLHYSLTSHSEHNHKPINGPLGTVIYCKASPQRNTHFLNELAQKLRHCRSIRVVCEPLTEMQDRYRGQSAPEETPLDPYRTLLALYGQLDRTPALLTREPLLSTTQAVHRRFSRSELAPPSAPAILGTPTKSAALSRLPPHKAPPSASSRLQLPRPCVALPHGGGTSLYMDSFTAPACPAKVAASAADQDEARRRNEGSRVSLRHVLEVPTMYSAESQTYGEGRMVLV